MINKTWKSDAFSLRITITPALIVFPSPSISFMNFFWWLLQAPQTRTDWAQLKLLCLSYTMLTAQNTVIKKLPCNRRELVRIWVEGNSLLSKRWSGDKGRSFSLHVGIYCSLIKKKKKVWQSLSMDHSPILEKSTLLFPKAWWAMTLPVFGAEEKQAGNESLAFQHKCGACGPSCHQARHVLILWARLNMLKAFRNLWGLRPT